MAEGEKRVTLGELAVLARALWRDLPSPATLWLTGDLGAGKTALVRAIVEEAGGAEVASPTFALVHEYGSERGPLVHVDCYRLRDPEEAIDIDFPELERRARLLMVEWPERGGAHVPPPSIHLQLCHTDDAALRGVKRLV